jgi:glycosyltransferase involved in cell wall biosynthesis
MPAPKVSVIVPIRNGAEFAAGCMADLKAQTFRDFEALVCVDSASDDGSEEAVRKAIGDDPRFRVLILGEDTHLAGNRNLGLDSASGEFVWLCDVDDSFVPDLLEECVRLQERDSSDLVIFNAVNVGPGERVPEKFLGKEFPAYRLSSAECMKGMQPAAIPVTAWSKFARRSVIEERGIRFRDSLAEDVDFTYRLLEACRTVTVDLRPLYAYRRNAGTLTTNSSHADIRGKDEVAAYGLADGIEMDPRVREDVLRHNAYMKMRSAGHMEKGPFVEYVRSPEFKELREKYLRGFEGWGCYHFPGVYHWGIRFYLKHFYKRRGKTYMRTDGESFLRKCQIPKD